MTRLRSLDIFRGLTILAMVLANFLAGADIVPAWLKHAPDIGLTVIDLIAPFFIFAIGLTYRAAFNRRVERSGLAPAYLQFIQRYLILIGIGTILSACESLFGFETAAHRWGVLEAIGVAGLLSLLVVRLPLPWIFVSGLGLLAVYQAALDRFWVGLVLDSSHGGLPGALSWSALMMLSIALAECFHSPRLRKLLYPFLSIAFLAGGWLLSWWTPISKNRVSAPYILLSLGLGAFVFLLIHWLFDRASRGLPLVETWGRNPLALYLLHMLLLGLFALPPVPVWYNKAPAWLILLQAGALVLLLSLAARWMERRGLILKL